MRENLTVPKRKQEKDIKPNNFRLYTSRISFGTISHGLPLQFPISVRYLIDSVSVSVSESLTFQLRDCLVGKNTLILKHEDMSSICRTHVKIQVLFQHSYNQFAVGKSGTGSLGTCVGKFYLKGINWTVI